ncbi:MAG: hypothetical protein HY719_13110 [Planctomycetes bacterium]|nr:hypothetical protein [Planctomycetota bacterium]
MNDPEASSVPTAEIVASFWMAMLTVWPLTDPCKRKSTPLGSRNSPENVSFTCVTGKISVNVPMSLCGSRQVDDVVVTATVHVPDRSPGGSAARADRGAKANAQRERERERRSRKLARGMRM